MYMYHVSKSNPRDQYFDLKKDRENSDKDNN